jgi:hypothetical protein
MEFDRRAIAVESVRDVGASDVPPVKPKLFKVVVCSGKAKRLELAVPAVDVPLVRESLGDRS